MTIILIKIVELRKILHGFGPSATYRVQTVVFLKITGLNVQKFEMTQATPTVIDKFHGF